MDTINFNSTCSSPRGYSELSNFYGGVEFEYMVQRFNQSEITRLFDHLETCDNEEFWRWLQILNPKGSKKKPATQRQMDYWFKNGIPIRGIAAQLLGTMVRPTATAKKRRKAVSEELGIDPPLDDDSHNPELTDDQKKAWMKVCLEHKFADQHFRDLLLSTGDAILHEIPLRGNGANNNWTYKVGKDGQAYGKDWLGQLLMEIRDELRTAQYTQFVSHNY